VPRAGSAYVYSYVTVGEFIAFTIGWNLILEYIIGVSSVARGLGVYIDSLFDYKMRNFWREIFPIDIDFLSQYPDLLSFGIVMVLTLILAHGVKESSWVHSFFTAINCLTIGVVIIAGSLVADPKNWFTEENEWMRKNNFGHGGFAPYGFSGIISGED
jgi:amino acid transporter